MACIPDFMKGAFQKYVTTTNAENFMPKPAGGCSAKALSFLVSHIYERLVIMAKLANTEEGRGAEATQPQRI